MSSSGKPSRNRTTAIPHGNNQNVRGQPPRAPRRAQPTASHRQRQIDEEALARELRRFVLALLKRPFDEIVAEFARIGRQPTSTQTAFDQNMALNRYRDVICNDRSRVSLVWPEGNTQSYIHANVIECNGTKNFICTQAPLDSTIDDFWRMVWQYRMDAIVMLCECTEKGKQKSSQYWPAKVNEKRISSGITVNCLSVNVENELISVSELELTFQSKSRKVVHYQWLGWPDHGVPTQTLACLRLLHRLRSHSAVIHCSAGIGRTGTLVSLDMAMKGMRAGRSLDLCKIVRDLRSQRHGSVQTVEQWLYIHRTLVALAENKNILTHEQARQFFRSYEAYIAQNGPTRS